MDAWSPDDVAALIAVVRELRTYAMLCAAAAWLGVGALVWSDLHHGGYLTLGHRMPRGGDV